MKTPRGRSLRTQAGGTVERASPIVLARAIAIPLDVCATSVATTDLRTLQAAVKTAASAAVTKMSGRHSHTKPPSSAAARVLTGTFRLRWTSEEGFRARCGRSVDDGRGLDGIDVAPHSGGHAGSQTSWHNSTRGGKQTAGNKKPRDKEV